jgi:hypothetical protein
VGNRATKPLPLDEAKRAAIAMLRERKETEPHDWIAELNKIAAAEVHRAWMMQEHKQWPRNLVGAESHPGDGDRWQASRCDPAFRAHWDAIPR